MGKILTCRGGRRRLPVPPAAGRERASCAVLIVLALTVFNACGRSSAMQKRAALAQAPAAAPAAPPQAAAPSAESEALRGVWRRILAAAKPEEIPGGYHWPPVLIGPGADEIARFNTMITAAGEGGDAVREHEINAIAASLPYSTLSRHGFLPPPRGSASARARLAAAKVPFIVVAPGLWRFLTTSVGGLNPDRAAFLLGHELSHVLKSHISRGIGPSVEALETTRAEEFEADAGGMALALRAGFSKENGQRLYQALEEELSYSSIEGKALTHPSNKERLEQLDTKQRELWRGMIDFDNGVFFLTVEQYDPAAAAFESVLKEFPDSYEAWANLGYSELMKYCDALEPKDLIALDLGPLVVGTFYERPTSLMARVKGFDGPLWGKAVNSLQRALAEAEKARAATALIKANLAVAFLVKEGRTADDVARARAFFADALGAAGANALSGMNRAAVLINAGVADAAGDNPAAALAKFDGVRKLDWWRLLRSPSFNSPYEQIGAALGSAECFNRQLALKSLARAPDESAEAMVGLCQCVRNSPAASHWQQVMLGRFNVPGVESPAQECASPPRRPLRVTVSASVLPNVDVRLGDRMREVTDKLTKLNVAYEVVGREFKRIDVPASGFEVLGSSDVLGIVFKDANALPVCVRDRSPTSPCKEFRVGMRQTQVEQILGTARGGTIYSTDTQSEYRFYPYAGLAFKYNNHARVARLVVVQAPRRG